MVEWRGLIRSFRYAFRGISSTFKREQTFRIQLIAALFVIALMFVFPTSTWEKVALILVTIFVLILELINTIFERLSDILKPRIHDYVKEIKDIMAAAVLIASIGALAVGILIFSRFVIVLFK